MTGNTELPESPESPERPEKPRRRWWQRWWAVVGGVGVVAGLVASGIVIYQTIPRHHQVFALTDPPSNKVTQERCAFTANGKGAPPAGQVVVVSNQVQGTGDSVDHLLHFGVATQIPPTDTWYADVQIGISNTVPGTAYTLTAWLMDAETVNRLTEATPGQHKWWNGTNPPAGAQIIATTTVTRMAAVANCH